MAARPDGHDPAARTLPVRPEPVRPEPVRHAPPRDREPRPDRGTSPDRAPSWLPGSDFERHVPRHDSGRGWRERLRWDPGRRGAAALGVLLVAAVAATGWWLAASRPHEVPISAQSPAAGPVTVSSSPISAIQGSPAPAMSVSPTVSGSAQPVVVDVAGKVRHPGIYELKAGSRVYDAVQAAGGPRPGVSTLSLNLAEPLRDGEQVVVGAPANGGGVAPDPGLGSSSTAATIVDLNSATLEQLETLPGVGPVLGQHILDWRDAHGQFASVDQLREVSGIGDVRFAQLRPLVTT
jgi:competence protein ComEA